MKTRLTLFIAITMITANLASATTFQNILLDVRGAALGGVHTGIAPDPGSALANPALLGSMETSGGHFLIRDWYGSGATSYAAGWVQPMKGLGLGLSWHRFGQDGVYTEDQIGLGLGGQVRILKRPVKLGANFKRLQVAFPGYEGLDYAGDTGTFSFDLAGSIKLGKQLELNWLEENLVTGEVQYLNDGETWRAGLRSSRQSLRYLWRSDLALILEHWGRAGRDPALQFGAELRFFDAFHVRAGSGSNSATAGFGLSAADWRADFAFESKGSLGTSLTFSISPLFGGRSGS